MKKNKLSARNGFTLIEMLVVIGIFLIVSSIIFASYPEFRSNISLRKTSQEIALSIRQAQVYALSVVESPTGTFPGYGVNFNMGTSDNSFVLFSDLNKDYFYEDIEKFKQFQISTGEKIYELCGTDAVGEKCDLDQLNIVFYRPTPVVQLNNGVDSNNFSNAKIKIKSLRGNTKTIQVWISGQISIE